MKMNHQHARIAERRLPRRIRCAAGFTIIELLVAVAIIIVLLSLLIVAMSFATRASQKSRTQSLMVEMKKGLIRFREDIGYYPPMLGPNVNQLRDLFPPPAPPTSLVDPVYAGNIQDWFSTCAPADYLIGWSSHREDGFGAVPNVSGPQGWLAETPPVGIRHPGLDGVWGATLTTNVSNQGRLSERMKFGLASWGSDTQNPQYPWDQGKIYGPYLELKDERLLAGITGYQNGEPQLVYPGEPGYTDAIPKTIVDYWGTPIRYFRKPYPVGSIGQSFRTGVDINRDGSINDADRIPMLSDVYVLRPWDIRAGAEVVTPYADLAGSAVATNELNSAEFALLSAGADKRLNPRYSRDPDEYNKDNLVEVGP